MISISGNYAHFLQAGNHSALNLIVFGGLRIHDTASKVQHVQDIHLGGPMKLFRQKLKRGIANAVQRDFHFLAVPFMA
jgi:hypothetical protein